LGLTQAPSKRFAAGLGESFDEAESVEVVTEHGVAALAAIHDMADGVPRLDARFAGHVGKLR